MKARLRTVRYDDVVVSALLFVCPGCVAGGPDGYDGIHMLPVNSPQASGSSWDWDGNLNFGYVSDPDGVFGAIDENDGLSVPDGAFLVSVTLNSWSGPHVVGVTIEIGAYNNPSFRHTAEWNEFNSAEVTVLLGATDDDHLYCVVKNEEAAEVEFRGWANIVKVA